MLYPFDLFYQPRNVFANATVYRTVIMSITSLGYRINLFLGDDPLWNGLNITLTTCVTRPKLTN